MNTDMKKQTAVQLLKESIDHELKSGTKMVVNWDMYLAMEKEQMMKTWTKAIDQTQERAWNVVRAYDDFDDYYNETYGGDK